MGGAAVKRQRAEDCRPARGLLIGATCGLGASVAHQLSGGHASFAAMAFVTLVSGLLAALLPTRRLGFPTLIALALVAQGAAHMTMSASAAHMHGADSASTRMLLSHLAVALVTAALAQGLNRGLLGVTQALLGWILPKWRRPRSAPAPRRVVPILDTNANLAVRPRATPATLRGPPSITRALASVS